MSDGTQAKPICAANLLAPTTRGTIKNATMTASTPRDATIVSVTLPVSVANASTGRLNVNSIRTA